MAAGLLVIFGWVSGRQGLTQIDPDFASMKFGTATCLVIIGGVLAVVGFSGRAPVVPVLFALTLVATFCLATLMEYVGGVRFGIDNPFGLDTVTSPDQFPGRPAPLAVFALFWLSVSLGLTSTGRAAAGQILSMVPLAIGQAAFIGYLFDVDALYRVGSFSSVALHTALALIAAGLGALLLSVGHGPMNLVAGNTLGGIMARQLIPLVAVVPTVLGWILLIGSDDGYYDQTFAFAVFVTLITLLGIVAMFLAARELRRSEVERHGTADVLDVTRRALSERDAYAEQLRSSEARLRAMVDNSVDAYIELSDDGRVRAWNPKAQDIFGFNRAEMLGRLLTETIIPPEQAGSHSAGMHRYLTTGEGPVLGQLLHLEGLHKDGHRIPLEFVICTTKTDGEPVFHACLRDDSPRLAAEAEVRRCLKTVEEFAAAAAHDLRSPLASIVGFAELLVLTLEDDPTELDTEQLRGYAARIVRTGNRCDTLIGDLLHYATFSKAEITWDPIDLHALVSEVLADHTARTQRPFRSDVAQLGGVFGDVTLLRQLLTNLVGNAVKYVPSDRDLRLVVTTQDAATPGRVLVAIRDNGDGIPDEDKERVFEVFQRRQSDHAAPGTGLGLALCRQAIERHGGQICVVDAPGGGAEFRFDLPVRAPRRR